MEDASSNPFENDSFLPEDVQEKLSSILEKYQQLSDEEKKEFQKGAFNVLLKNLNKLPSSTLLPMWLAPYQPYILFTIAVLFVVLLFVFSALVLYRHRFERKRRQEEKKKRKEIKAEMKKKKKT
ncbi:uncharacterized protein LOC109860553 [Pseudomyrmex gracilis]|uniref:uncharacterized protein LOC109860553 n=1 Tax=Pseudomyrmex gracilis TaxID=219809 RepID=UPI0009953A00|nr:uncharacterized protein LOC109860553 [Pseudomyrmex gracilis]